MVDPSYTVKYIIMQTFLIPSIICSIFTLSQLLSHHRLRSTLHHHTTIILLIICLCDSFLSHPFTLNYLRLGFVSPFNHSMCLSWNFFNALSATAVYWTITWNSVERHLLIFSSLLFNSRRRRIIFHYIPLFFFTIIYPISANIFIIFLYPCTHQFNTISLFCGYVCALRIPSVALYFRIAHNFVPVSIVTCFTFGLIIRVINQKRQLQNNRLNWRRHRRMLIQLLTLTWLFLILTLPSFVVGIVQNCCQPTFAASLQSTYFTLFIRFITILMPFMCFSSLPEIWSKLLLCKKNQGQSVGTVPLRQGPTKSYLK